MSNYHFILNYRKNKNGSVAWDFIPQELWRRILQVFVVPHCTGFALSHVAEPSDLSKFKGFKEKQPSCIGTIQREPNFGDQDFESLPMFALEPWVVKMFDEVLLNQWTVNNEDYPSDEIIFVKDGDVLLTVIPFESELIFSLNDSELTALKAIDPRIPGNLHPQNSGCV